MSADGPDEVHERCPTPLVRMGAWLALVGVAGGCIGPLGRRAWLVVVALGAAVVLWVADRWRRRDRPGLRERARQALLARRARHVPDQALSPARPDAARHAERGLSRDQ